MHEKPERENERFAYFNARHSWFMFLNQECREKIIDVLRWGDYSCLGKTCELIQDSLPGE
jgi:hypothetical protein